MELSTKDRIDLLQVALEKVDLISVKFSSEIERITVEHKINGEHIEYTYVEHFHQEIIGLSRLFEYLLRDDFNSRYVFFAVRASFEVLLYLEYVLRLAKEDKKRVLELLSKDMTQMGAAIDAAIPSNEEHHMHKMLKNVALVNKIVKTDFSADKIKANTKVFPTIKELCDKSSLNLKDFKGDEMYHIYTLYSESNHLRLGNQYSISEDVELLNCWALEYFLEIYIKFYEQLLDTKLFSNEYIDNLKTIRQSVGINW